MKAESQTLEIFPEDVMLTLRLKGWVGMDQPMEREVEAEGAGWAVRKEPGKDKEPTGSQAWLRPREQK